MRPPPKPPWPRPAVTRFFLRQGGRSADIAACRERYEDAITVTAAQLEDLLPPEGEHDDDLVPQMMRALEVPQR